VSRTSPAAAVSESPPLPLRTRAAVRLGELVARSSRLVGAGAGVVVGGWATLLVDPGALRRLTRARNVSLVSGTNGKTTTSRLLAEALRTLGPVAANTTGANMPAGLVSAAAGNRREQLVLEVDESYLPAVIAASSPGAVLLLNLTRDQLDRVGEVKQMATRWRRALEAAAVPLAIGNADDPLVVWALGSAPAVWVSAEHSWHADSSLCPACGEPLERTGDRDWSSRCGLRRPEPDWSVEGDELCGPAGRYRLDLALPGHANRANAAFAVAAAAGQGVEPEAALDRLRRVSDVEGRYLTTRLGAHQLRLLLAKNPAGWVECLALLVESDRPVMIAINARTADGHDPSWLWDVPFERLAGRDVVALGDRRLDLALRLEVAGAHVTVAAEPLAALETLPPGPVDVVGNYTAFVDLRSELRRG
jgi:lipid II isoglutaminyl synthase (glutamine-hydrolysing)